MRKDSKPSERLDLADPPLRRSGPSSTWEASRDSKPLRQIAKIANWIERFAKIRTKEGKLTGFRCNDIQEILLQYVAWCWENGIMVRVVTPKSRQLGSSTFWELLEYGMCELIPGYQAAIVAHDDNGAAELFGKVETVKRGLKNTEWKDSALVNDQGGYLKWATESALWSATIKTGDGLGKGGTLSGIHFSEVANFSDKRLDAGKAISAIVNSMAKTPMCMEIYESTAKGKDPIFYKLCEDARDPNSGVAMQLIFLPWFLDRGYSMTWGDYRREATLNGKTDPGEKFERTDEETQLCERLSTTVIGPTEQLYRYRVDLTDDQLVWRRWAIANKCRNDIDTFYQYYPSFYEECFTASSSSAFDADTIEWARRVSRPHIARGDVVKSVPKNLFIPNVMGKLRIWSEPQQGSDYVIGADPGGTTKKSDPSALYVVHRVTLEQVAALHGHPEWDHFADDIVDIGYYYNTATLVVENNHNPAVVSRIFRKNYPRLYCYFVEAKHDALYGKTPGFNTNKKTRPEMINVLRPLFREKKVLVNDPEFWKEMSTFVWTPRAAAANPEMDGDYRAVGANHDDRIMALAIALTQCMTTDAPVVESVAIVPSSAYDLYLAMQKKRPGQYEGQINVL